MKALTNPIAALTMLAGRRREKRRAERARQQQLAMDQANRASAASDYLQ
ncbi:hypothetical protein [Sharpea azabuensis]|nr:hypothetical protein [Sharpea azabuensis]